MKRLWTTTAGGILSIIAGAFLIFEIIIAGASFRVEGLSIWAGWWVNMAPLMLFGIIAIVGGICALQKRVWGLALAGTICATAFSLFVAIQTDFTSIGFRFVIIAAISVLALIFISRAKSEFT